MRLRKILTTVGLTIGLVAALPGGIANAGSSYVGNTCWGTDRYIKYARADGVWRNLGCGGVVGSVLVVSSAYPFRLRNERGSEVCWRAGNHVAVDPYNNVEHVNAWTVRSC